MRGSPKNLLLYVGTLVRLSRARAGPGNLDGGISDIFNTDQGSQFTSSDFTRLLKDNGIRISMDGQGRWRDNVFVERLWRSVKYEAVYLKAYDTVADADAKANLGCYLDFYNTRRPQQTLDGRTPDTVYSENLPKEKLAA
jgi:putative transposase